MSQTDQQTPLGRHGRKVRSGCFNCKARKVKCSEVRPKCESCYIRGLPCVYPTKREQMVLRRRPIKPIQPEHKQLVSPSAPISHSPSTFSATDFRYFHHFLISAYPHLPHDSESAWSFEVPQLSHHYKPLLHAALSLGASHLAAVTESQQQMADSLFHRGIALAGLGGMLAQKSRTSEELDVMLAMCYALTIQSSFMTDGLGDFLFMIRGCALITKQIAARPKPKTIFCMDPSNHIMEMMGKLPATHFLEPSSLDKGINCLESLRPFITEKPHLQFADTVLNTLVALQYSTSQEAYLMFLNIYATIYTMDEQNFQRFIALDNPIGRIMLGYFSATLILMLPYLKHEIPDRLSLYSVFAATVRWADSARNHVPSEWLEYAGWPFEVTHAFRDNFKTFRPDVEGLVRQVVVLANKKPGPKQKQLIQPSKSGRLQYCTSSTTSSPN